MSAIILNSNANSALINTINASASKMNPNVYSSPPIFPSCATIYQKTESSSGSIGANNTLTFDLMKYGIAEQMLLCYTKDTHGTDPYDFLDVIDRVELLSSSKVIDTLTSYDILALASDLEHSQYTACNKSFIEARGASASELICVPLVFSFFKEVNTNLNLQFNEPMSVRLRFGSTINYGATGGGGNSAVSSCYLKLRYKAYNESDYSEVLTQNYNEPELNQLVKTMYDENTVNTGNIAANATNGAQGTPIELKNTDCVNNFYIIAKEVSATKPTAPHAIDRIRFTASGQEIFDLSGEELFWSRLGMNGFATRGSSDSTANVVKVQMGRYLYPNHDNPQTNTLSLRELNNPKIQVFLTNGANQVSYDIVVVEEALSIVSSVSSSGRVQTSLSN